jgi:kynureninase
MKNTITILLTILITTAHAQVSVSMRTGYSFKTNDALVAPGVNYTAGGLNVGLEMIVNTRAEAPVDFGFRSSYQYKFLEAGAGTYYRLYSLDEYDKDRNHLAVSVFTAAHWKVFFVQYEYICENKLSIGLKVAL